MVARCRGWRQRGTPLGHNGYENAFDYEASSTLHAKSLVQKLSTIRHG
jgi:hypothetical protein